ncbi:MAG: cation diffusion facilitator family transporter [Vicingaceae bacterium]|nr:cation diffusion facilitator family transporter [Vicingaceae bacterium]
MGHDHSHHHSNKNLKVAFFLNLAFTIIEVFAGFYVNSMAIIADAIHDMGDSLSLGTSWYLQNKSNKAANKKYSYGYRRFSLFGALINCVVLIAGGIYAIIETIDRFINPEMPDAKGMMWFAFLGISVNGYAAWKLSTGKSMNEKVVSWHLIEDVLGWVAILIVAIILQFKEIAYLDPTLSVLITLYILWNSIKKLKETLFIFLQGKPKEINKDEIINEILAVKGVVSAHDTHIWSLDGEHHVFTTHVKVGKLNDFNELKFLKSKIKEILAQHHFEHYTIETDLDDENCEFDSEL